MKPDPANPDRIDPATEREPARSTSTRSRAGRAPGLCVATVTTPSFLPGTLVTLGSFLACHPGFAGDLVVFHDGLPQSARDCLAPLPGLRFEQVSFELRARLARLAHAYPDVANRLARFHSLEAFRLKGYRKVLFCDSDLLFRRRVDELFDRRTALLCCGDGPYYRGNVRDAVTFLELTEPAAAGLQRTFNAGFLLIGAELLENGRCHADLLSMVTPESWRDVRAKQTDQILYNRYFSGRQTLVGATYNYLLAHDRDIRAREPRTAADPRVLHFNMRTKPWQIQHLVRWAANPHGGEILQAQAERYSLWYEALLAQFEALHRYSGLGSARRDVLKQIDYAILGPR